MASTASGSRNGSSAQRNRYSPSSGALGQYISLAGSKVVGSKRESVNSSAMRREMAAYSSGVTVRDKGTMSRRRIFSGVWLCVL